MADTLASLVVALQVESAQLRKGLDEANGKLDRFGKKAEEASASFRASFDKINKAAEGLRKTIETSLAFNVAKDALSGLWSVVKDGTTALAAQEKSTNQLRASLDLLGGDTQGLLTHFVDQAEGLENLTLVDRETINAVQQLQIQMGVAPRAIDQTTRAILDYAAATGQNAVGVTQKLLTAVESGKEDIAKFGVSVDLTTDKTTNMERVTAALSERFRGSAKAATEGLAGQFGHLQKAVGDAGKALAEYLNRTGLSAKVTDALTQALAGLTFALSKEHEQDKAMVARTDALNAAMEERRQALEAIRNLEESRAKTEASMRGIYDGRIKQEREFLAVAEQKIAKLNAEKAAANAATLAEAKRGQDGEKAVKTTKALKTTSDAERLAQELEKKIAADIKVRGEGGLFGGLGESAGKTLGLGMAGPMGEGVRVDALTDVGRKVFEVQRKQADDLARAARERLEAERAFTEGLEVAQAARLRAGIDNALGMGGNLGGAIAATAEGGLGGGILALLQGSEAFSSVLATLDEIFTMLAEGLGGLLEPLLPLLEISLMLDRALLLLLKPLQSIVEAAAPALFEALKMNAIALIGIAYGIGTVYNVVTEAIAKVIDKLASVEFFGQKPYAFLAGQAEDLRDSMIDTSALGDALGDLTELTYEQAQADRELRKATDKATASMLNVPPSWKVNLARFNAINPDLGRAPGAQSAGAGPVFGTSTSSLGGAAGGSGGGTSAPAPVVNVILDGQALANALRIEVRKGDARTRGNPSGLSPAYAGG